MIRPFQLKGKKFGRLTVICRNEAGRWSCVCDCGEKREFPTSSLTGGGTRSCGCLRREVTGQRFTKHGATKGGKLSPEYRAWCGMKIRCDYENRDDFKYYGAHGIQVCSEWRDNFEKFLEHVGPRPSPKHSLDRYPDNNGNYEPGNVRWATATEQYHNRRST